jgi:hypothetical protein
VANDVTASSVALPDIEQDFDADVSSVPAARRRRRPRRRRRARPPSPAASSGAFPSWPSSRSRGSS